MIQFTLLNTTPPPDMVKHFKPNALNLKAQCIEFNQADKVSFKGQINYISFDELIRKAIGVLTKEDTQAIKSNAQALAKKYNGSNIADLIELNRKNYTRIESFLEKYGIKSEKTERKTKFTDNLDILDKSARKKLKSLYIKILTIRECFLSMKQPDPLLNNPSVHDWFKNINYDGKLPNIFHSLYAHPIERAKFLIADFSEKEQKEINKQALSIKNKKVPIQSIEAKKNKTLNKIISIFSSDNFLKNGILTKIEFEKLRKNVFQYEILDRALCNNGMFSKEIESVSANAHIKLSAAKIGDFIDGIGLVVQQTMIHDKNKGKEIPCLVVFNKEKKDFSFKLLKIDTDHENAASDISKVYQNSNSQPFVVSAEQLSELDKKAKAIIEAEKELLIAKVYFNVLPIQNIKGFLKDINNPEKVESIFNKLSEENVKKVALVINFINADSKKYYEGGRKVVLPLIHLLQKNDCNYIFMTSHAIGENKKAPLPMHIRAGFEPISPTREEIVNLTDNFKKRWDPNIPVYMYLPKDAMVNEFVEKEQPLRGIFELTS